MFSVLVLLLAGCGKKENPPEEQTPAPILSGVSINGVPLSEFVLLVPRMYYLPEYTILNYFEKYCGVKIESKFSAAEISGPAIQITNQKSDGSNCDKFETEIYFRDGKLFLVCDNKASAQQVIYTFFAKYLSNPENTSIVFPEDGTPVYSLNEADNWDDANPSLLTIQDKILRSCYKLEEILQYEKTLGISFTYENHGYENTIELARQKNNRCTNCVIVGNWVMKDAGFYTKGIYNHMYGDPAPAGYTFSGESEAFFEENFTIFDYTGEDRTLQSLYDDGKILPGDIIGFRDHNQTILPEGYAFDGGRAAANMESREIGGKFRCWIIENPCRMTKVDYVFRANDAR